MIQQDFKIQRLGECTVNSPLKRVDFIDDEDHVLYHRTLETTKEYLAKNEDPPNFEAAGPREKIYFDPEKVSCGIVTCGGLCPGINDVIRAIVMSLHYRYEVRSIFGFKYGYQGLVPEYGHEPVPLTPENVIQINEMGGTILASSRGNQDPKVMVDTLEKMKIGILFCIGGDGTQRGALAISEEAKKGGSKSLSLGFLKP